MERLGLLDTTRLEAEGLGEDTVLRYHTREMEFMAQARLRGGQGAACWRPGAAASGAPTAEVRRQAAVRRSRTPLPPPPRQVVLPEASRRAGRTVDRVVTIMDAAGLTFSMLTGFSQRVSTAFSFKPSAAAPAHTPAAGLPLSGGSVSPHGRTAVRGGSRALRAGVAAFTSTNLPPSAPPPPRAALPCYHGDGF